MRLVKSRLKYKCDFCSRTSMKKSMERHEKICWKNPNRYCELCRNKGYVIEDFDVEIPCIYCSKY